MGVFSRGPKVLACISTMASSVGCSTLLLPIILQWFGRMATANEKTTPVWTWVDGSLLLDQPSRLTAGQQYPGCRADTSVWTPPSGSHTWLFGGKEGNGLALNDLWLYSMPTVEWSNTRRGKEQDWPPPRYAAAMCGVGGSTLVLYGGVGSEGKHLKDTWLYHLHNESWTLRSSTSPRPHVRDRLAHWCTHNALWIYGGATSDPASPMTMWRLSLRSYQWTNVLSGVESKRSKVHDIGQASATWVMNGTQLYMYVLGGTPPSACLSCRADETVAKSARCDLWRFSTDSQEWEKVAMNSGDESRNTNELDRRPSCSAQVTSWPDADDKLWLLSHGNGGNYSTGLIASPSEPNLWMFDLRIGSWTRFEHTTATAGQQRRDRVGEGMQGIPSQPPPRASCASWSWNGTFYLFGGLAGNGTVGALNDLWEFRLSRAEGLLLEPASALAVPPVAVFFMSLGGLCVLSSIVFGVIFFSKCSSGPRLKPPNHFGDKIRYSPVETNDVFIT